MSPPPARSPQAFTSAPDPGRELSGSPGGREVNRARPGGCLHSRAMIRGGQPAPRTASPSRTARRRPRHWPSRPTPRSPGRSASRMASQRFASGGLRVTLAHGVKPPRPAASAALLVGDPGGVGAAYGPGSVTRRSVRAALDDPAPVHDDHLIRRLGGRDAVGDGDRGPATGESGPLDADLGRRVDGRASSRTSRSGSAR